MKKQVPLEKQSKRVKRARDLEKRGGWGALTPILRVVESRKKYSRTRQKEQDRRQPPQD